MSYQNTIPPKDPYTFDPATLPPNFTYDAEKGTVKNGGTVEWTTEEYTKFRVLLQSLPPARRRAAERYSDDFSIEGYPKPIELPAIRVCRIGPSSIDRHLCFFIGFVTVLAVVGIAVIVMYRGGRV